MRGYLGDAAVGCGLLGREVGEQFGLVEELGVAGLYGLQFDGQLSVVFEVYRQVNLAECALAELFCKLEDLPDC